MKKLVAFGFIISAILIMGCIEQNSTTTIAEILRESKNSGMRTGQVIEIQAGTVINSVELARMIGISYTELGFYADNETRLVVKDYSREQNITTSKTIIVYAEADCNNQITSPYAADYDVYDCMVRFKPY